MVRVNLIPPVYLADEHLAAEHVELQMLLTFIKKYPDGYIPDNFTLNKGHMSFFRNKYIYITYRLVEVRNEMRNRNMNVLKTISLSYKHDSIHYEPDKVSKKIVWQRICDRLRNPKAKKNKWHYYKVPIDNINEFIYKNTSKLSTTGEL